MTVPMPIDRRRGVVSSYLDYLPAILREDVDEQGVNFLGRFLLAFEAILSGPGDGQHAGIEELVDNLPRYFDPLPREGKPLEAPEDFLPWLASWVGLTLRQDWAPDEKRRMIANIVPLYRLRGTRAGLTQLLATYTDGLLVRVTEFDSLPFYFQVEMYLNVRDPALQRQKEQIARAIIEQEKPAQTYYTLLTHVPTMQIAVHSTVGQDSILGSQQL